MTSPAAIAAANVEQTGEAWIVLLEIDHDTLVAPIRVANNTENITSNGNVFLAGAFNLNPPDDFEGVPHVRLEIDNVDRAIVDAARSLSSPASVVLYIVLASTPDTIEASYPMSLSAVDYDAEKVSGTLIYEDVLNEQYPAQTFNPARFPGLF